MSLASLTLWGCGCGCGGGNVPGIKPSLQQTMNDMNDLAQRVDGNYDKLTPIEKQKVLEAYGGNEEVAKKRFRYIVHPPGSGVKAPP